MDENQHQGGVSKPPIFIAISKCYEFALLLHYISTILAVDGSLLSDQKGEHWLCWQADEQLISLLFAPRLLDRLMHS